MQTLSQDVTLLVCVPHEQGASAFPVFYLF